MEEENQIIHIPINEHEEDMDTKLSKDMKREINSNSQKNSHS